MAGEEEPPPKWEGTVTAHLRASTAEAVWPLIQDFYGIHKWLPTVDSCHKVDQHQLGNHVRYCAAGQPQGNGDLMWCHEKLLSSDPLTMSLTYQVLDNNIGFKAYQATLRAVPVPIPINGGGADSSGCKIEWSFLADPIEGWTQEDLIAYLDAALQGMAMNMEKALLSST